MEFSLQTVPGICKSLPAVTGFYHRVSLLGSLPLLLTLMFCSSVSLAAAPTSTSAPVATTPQCHGRIYLTFDTGSQSQAELIASVLRRHHIKATFFLANEKTIRDDYSLDMSWNPYWKTLVSEGHAFGTHTFDHVYAIRDLPGGLIEVRPQFGPQAGQKQAWTAQQYCDELRRVDQRFLQLTGKKLDPYWRAPGGKLTPNLQKAGESCGYQHVGWAAAGFSGDELSSEKFSNPLLLKRALTGLRDGDIFMAHLGIWSRKQAWAPENLEPLISGLEQKGYCFATLREHPSYRVTPP